MAGNDTAALVVALSAQLTKFEKDMQGAVAIADKRSKEIETRFGALNESINKQLSNFAANASSQLGPIGSILGGLGPIGLTVAASLGTLALAFAFVSDKVDMFAEKSKRIKEAAETAGLTITQFRLLSAAGSKVGLDFEQTEKIIDRLAVGFAELKTKGTGDLFDQLVRIDSGLVREVASARNLAEAIEILARTYRGLNDEGKRIEFSKAIGGLKNLGAGRFLDEFSGAGGFKGMEDAAVAAGKKIDDALTERIAKLSREIGEIKKKTDDIWGRAFAEDVLTAQKNSASNWEQIAIFAERAWNAAKGYVAAKLAQALKGGQTGAQSVDESGFLPPPSAVPLPTARPGSAPQVAVSPAVNLELMRKWTSVLGDAITPTEQLKLKILELDAAQEKGGVSDGVRTRALAAFNVAQQAALLSTRERLGVATEEQIIQVKLAQLSLDAAKFKLSQNEVDKASVVILKEAKLAADALAVRQSYLPGLKQLELDAANLGKNLDTAAVASVNNLGTALGDIVSGTAKAGDAFRNFGSQVVRSIIDMIIRMTILAPIAKGLQAILGGPLGGIPLPGGAGIGQGGIGARAGGGPVSAGMPYIIGEHGPEIMVPQSSGTVLPNELVRNARSPSPSVTQHISIIGPSGDSHIEQMVMRGVNQANAQAIGMLKSFSTHVLPGRLGEIQQEVG